ncbi:hypothetical protein [Frankia sp. AgKG'84/4]
MIGLIATGAGCSSAEPASAVSGAQPALELPSASAAPESTPSADLHGIVVAGCGSREAREVFGYDPETGNRTFARTFPSQGAARPPVFCAPVPSAPVLRQQFNTDFTRVAASTSAGADGGYHAGYLDSAGTFTDLTKTTSDYSGVSKQRAVGFNPVTGRLWFETPISYGSVDPDVGPASSRPEPGTPRGNRLFLNAYYNVYFAPDGKTIEDAHDATLTAFSSGGKIEVRTVSGGFQAVGSNFQVGAPGSINTGTPVLHLPTGADTCRPSAVVDSSTFLCLGSEGKKLYKMSINGDRMTVGQWEILPESNRTIEGVVISPSGSDFAFIAKAGQSRTLYSMSLTDAGQPRHLVDLGEMPLGLAEWI